MPFKSTNSNQASIVNHKVKFKNTKMKHYLVKANFIGFSLIPNYTKLSASLMC